MILNFLSNSKRYSQWGVYCTSVSPKSLHVHIVQLPVKDFIDRSRIMGITMVVVHWCSRYLLTLMVLAQLFLSSDL